MLFLNSRIFLTKFKIYANKKIKNQSQATLLITPDYMFFFQIKVKLAYLYQTGCIMLLQSHQLGIVGQLRLYIIIVSRV